jgi:hypothetical protein
MFVFNNYVSRLSNLGVPFNKLTIVNNYVSRSIFIMYVSLKFRQFLRLIKKCFI